MRLSIFLPRPLREKAPADKLADMLADMLARVLHRSILPTYPFHLLCSPKCKPRLRRHIGLFSQRKNFHDFPPMMSHGAIGIGSYHGTKVREVL